MKKLPYEEATLELLLLNSPDIITTSGADTPNRWDGSSDEDAWT